MKEELPVINESMNNYKGTCGLTDEDLISSLSFIYYFKIITYFILKYFI
jgi:hypothetical protein